MSSEPIPVDHKLSDELVSRIAGSLDQAGIENVLWGNYLLTVYSVPTCSNVNISAFSTAGKPMANDAII